MDGFGPHDETIVDYTIYDAIQSGFQKIVFVIRRNMENDFKEVFQRKFSGLVQVEFVFQELDDLPSGFTAPEGRIKPWGTAHAVLTTAPWVDEPFAVVNADDYYGRESLKSIYYHLSQLDNGVLDGCLVGFVLGNTLSEHGAVSRAICEVSQDGFLNGITERVNISKKEGGGAFYTENEKQFDLSGNEIVSMNLMGFTSTVFALINQMFVNFLEKQGTELKSEFFISSVLDEIRKSGLDVPVIISNEPWFGVTYKEDKQNVKQRINRLIAQGVYPNQLFE